MSLEQYEWILKQQEITPDILELSRQLDFIPSYSALLYNRGITSFELARKFFKPTPEDLYNPFQLADMDKAVDHLSEVIRMGKKIMFYGDYDVDGTTSVALMCRFFRTFYPNFTTYIPDRYTEGYGLTSVGIAKAAAEKVHTIVALDCGIKSLALASEIGRLGMYLIVVDHHTPGAVLPEAVAVVDPKRPDCHYPFKELSACGLAYKLALTLAHRLELDPEYVHSMLDLVALSIGADMVPLVDENRTLMKLGLQVLNQHPSPGLQALITSAGIKTPVTSHHIGFLLGPRINAAGRIEHANLALSLLTTDQPCQANQIAQEIEKLNTERKTTQDLIASEAIHMVKHNPSRYRYAIVLQGHDWLKGVIGIVAARLVEEFHRPAIVFTRSGDFLVGSARSILTVNIYDALNSCSHIIHQFGGHSHAAGVTLLPDNFELFFRSISEVIKRQATPETFKKKLFAEAEIKLADIDDKLIRLSTTHLQPTGIGNPTPHYISRNLKVLNNSRLIGSDQSHIKLYLHEPETNTYIQAVWFSKGHHFPHIINAGTVDAIYTLDFNTFNGHSAKQLKLLDLKINP